MPVSVATAQELPTGAPAGCAMHPSRASVGACVRCGRTACVRCRNSDGACPECVYQAVAKLPPSRTHGTAARALVLIHAAVSGLVGAVGLAEMNAAPSSTVDPSTGLETWSATEAARTVLEIPYALLSALTVFLFLRWFALVVRHLRARALVTVSPVSATLAWLIPGVNLVQPPLLMRAVAAVLREPQAPIARWWTAWLLALSAGALSMSLAANGFGAQAAGASAVAAAVALVVAARLCTRVIDAVENGMRRRM